MWNYQIFWIVSFSVFFGFLLCMFQLFPDSHPPDYDYQPVSKLWWSLITTHSYAQVLEPIDI